MKKFLLVFLVFLVLVIALPFFWVWSLVAGGDADQPLPVPSQSSLRITTSGEVAGFTDRYDSHAWLGIPFAAPPVGALRWRAPRPPLPHEGRFEALTAGNMCPQISSGEGGERGTLVGDEDCLYLNIWAPIHAAEHLPTGADRWPVMVWIHGGGNSIGHGASQMYNGSLLASEHKVIVISINYRLGPFGWFRHPALASDDATGVDASGNYGTLDIIAALEWIQGNITNFGGDPQNVTIYGESAGGVNVLSMMASPLAKGLFHRAIVQSGGYAPASVESAENFARDGGHRFSSREVVSRLLVEAGIAKDNEDAMVRQQDMTPEGAREIAAFLRNSVTPGMLFDIYNEGTLGMLQFPAVIADGGVLPVLGAEELFRDPANYNAVPLIIGTNRDEVKLFLALSSPSVKRVLGIPVGMEDPATYERNNRYGSDMWKVRGVDTIAEVITANPGAPVFAYRFDVDDLRDMVLVDFKDLLGAAHAFEIPFVFGNFGPPFTLFHPESWRDQRELLSVAMMSYWAEFARGGDPGKGRDGEHPAWTPWTNEPGQDRLMIFDYESDQGITMTDLWITVDDIKARMLADTSFPSETAFCESWRQAFNEPTADGRCGK